MVMSISLTSRYVVVVASRFFCHVALLQDVVVGDIALLEPGEVIPCDGIFLSGHNVKCDESAATGEADAIKKASYSTCLQLKNARNGVHPEDTIGGQPKHVLPTSSHIDCFVISGSKVLEGVGQYVVVAVGTKSFNGRIMMGERNLIPPLLSKYLTSLQLCVPMLRIRRCNSS